MLFGFMGFEPHMTGFTVHPKLPTDWPALTIDQIRWQDQNISINATKNTIAIAFIGPEREVNIDLPAGQWKWIPVQGSAKTVVSPVNLTTKSGETVRFERIQ